MVTVTGTLELRQHLERMASVAQHERGVPPEVTQRAVDATLRAMRRDGSDPAEVSERLLRRSSAYFRAVVRRSSVRRSAAPALSARFVVETIVHDLRAAGVDGARIWREIDSGWSGRLPADLLEEYRAVLCGVEAA